MCAQLKSARRYGKHVVRLRIWPALRDCRVQNYVASAESTGGATCQGRCRGILPREQSALACASARRTGQLLQMRQLVTFVVTLQAPRSAQIPVRVTRRRTQHRADAARTWAPGRAANADVQCGACKTPA